MNMLKYLLGKHLVKSGMSALLIIKLSAETVLDSVSPLISLISGIQRFFYFHVARLSVHQIFSSIGEKLFIYSNFVLLSGNRLIPSRLKPTQLLR